MNWNKCLASLFCECLYTIKGNFPVWKAIKWFALYYMIWFQAYFQYVPHTITHYSVGVPSLLCFDMVIFFYIRCTYFIYYILFLSLSPLRLLQYVYVFLYRSFLGVSPLGTNIDMRYPRVSQFSMPYRFIPCMVKRTSHVLHRIHYISLLKFFGLFQYCSP